MLADRAARRKECNAWRLQVPNSTMDARVGTVFTMKLWRYLGRIVTVMHPRGCDVRRDQ
jgi:hypothetical protein